MNDFTNGRPFLITHSKPEGSRSQRTEYLLPDGTRHSVIVDQSDHTDETATLIGDALAQGRRGRTKNGQHG